LRFWFIRRHRGLSVLISVLLLSFLLLTYEIRFSEVKASLPKRLVMVVVGPFLGWIQNVSGAFTSVWGGYIDLRQVRKQNQDLKEEINRLRQEEMLLAEAKRENERLHQLLKLRQIVPGPTIASRVIGKDPSNWFRSILLDKGFEEGVSKNTTVFCPQGLVGRVTEVMDHTCRVQVITDPNYAAGALIQGSRVAGIVVGEVGPYCRLRFLPQDAQIEVGALIVTSGMGGLSPKGIPIGTVSAVERKKGALFQEARVVPRVDLFRIEEVLILAKPSRSEIRWPEDSELK
jgi:rod shape-determining protein MreC